MPVVVTTGYVGAVFGQGCPHARCVQTVLGSRREENCVVPQFAVLDKVADVPVCAVHRRLWTSLWSCSDVGSLAGGLRLSQSSWTFQLYNRDGYASSVYGGDEGFFRGFSAFFALLRVVPELSASFRSPRR